MQPVERILALLKTSDGQMTPEILAAMDALPNDAGHRRVVLHRIEEMEAAQDDCLKQACRSRQSADRFGKIAWQFRKYLVRRAAA